MYSYLPRHALTPACFSSWAACLVLNGSNQEKALLCRSTNLGSAFDGAAQASVTHYDADGCKCMHAGAHIDSSQMLPSPFDNMQGGAASVQSIPSSMQQAAPAASLGAGAPISATSPELCLKVWFLVLLEWTFKALFSHSSILCESL